MADELPSDALFNIFSRLPVKSLARFRCVCKLWCKYIDDPYLAVIHDKLAMEEPMLLSRNLRCLAPCEINFLHIIKSKQPPIPTGRFVTRLLCSMKIISDYESSSMGLEAIKHPSLEYSFDRVSSSGCPAIDLVWGCCNGLLLARTVQKRDHDTVFAVIHPLRKELHVLPQIKLVSRFAWNSPRRESCGIGFDASTNTYKVVCVSLRKHSSILKPEENKENLRTMVHVIGTNTWREIPSVPYHPMCTQGVFVEGRLHWLVSYFQITKVVLFDVKSEEFGTFDPPRQRGRVLHGEIYNHLVNLRGELGYVYHDLTKDKRLEVWVLEKTEWVMRCRFPHKPPLPCDSCIIVLGCWNKDGDILFTTTERKKELFVYHVSSGILQKAGWIDKNPYLVHMYQGSLCSLFSIHGAYPIKY